MASAGLFSCGRDRTGFLTCSKFECCLVTTSGPARLMNPAGPRLWACPTLTVSPPSYPEVICASNRAPSHDEPTRHVNQTAIWPVRSRIGYFTVCYSVFAQANQRVVFIIASSMLLCHVDASCRRSGVAYQPHPSPPPLAPPLHSAVSVMSVCAMGNGLNSSWPVAGQQREISRRDALGLCVATQLPSRVRGRTSARTTAVCGAAWRDDW